VVNLLVTDCGRPQMEKRRLGRGLEALFGSESGTMLTESEPSRIALDRIDHNPYQPRRDFDADELAGLQESIRAHGILQPLVVRSLGDRFQLIAGERRLRAAQSIGMTDVPVHVVDFNDQEVLEAALVENIQRSDLNPIEKAQGFKDYLDRFGMTQDGLASQLGLDRSTISNLVNLLDLPTEVQDAIRLGQISLGHAKVLKGLDDSQKQIALCQEIIARGHSVRAVEAIIRSEKAGIENSTDTKPNPARTAHVEAIEAELRQKLGVRIDIRVRDNDRGQIIAHFESNDDFERLLQHLRAG
jgi:ParB family transcriptional regulator, chromosome partitioning protein